MAIALEQLVVSEAAAPYHRALAWFRLLKVWGCLRTDDHRGLAPTAVNFTAGFLEATLTRTKTSGHDKIVQTLPL